MRAEQIQEPANGLRASDWHDGDPLIVKTPTAAFGERFERAPVADPFNEHDRTRVDADAQRM